MPTPETGTAEVRPMPVTATLDLADAMRRVARRLLDEYLLAGDLVRAKRALEMLASVEGDGEGAEVIELAARRKR